MNAASEIDSPTIVTKPDMSPESFDILLIEDDAVQSAILVEFLVLLRYRVRVASTGQQALESARQSVPDLVLLDIHLPDVDGLNLLRNLHEIEPQLAVVAISADTSDNLLFKTLTAGAEEFLQKPLVFSELAIRLENVLTLVSFRKQSIALRKILETEKEMLSRYFPADAVDAILNSHDEHRVAPAVAPATVMAFDLRNSTLLVETLGAAAYANVLNSVMADLLDFVTSDGGNVVRLTGDGFIASFADPFAAGIKGALSCAERISVYFCNLRRAKLGPVYEDLRYGIGIATGSIFSGNIGTFRRMEFTIVGNAVSRAIRLEELTKRLAALALLDEPTKRYLNLESIQRRLVEIRGRRTSIYSLVFDPVTGRLAG